MKTKFFALFALVVLPLASVRAQSPMQSSGLGEAISRGTPFMVRLHPGESNGSLIGGQTYRGYYDPASDMFTVSGPHWQANPGRVIPMTATYPGGDPLANEMNLWGAGYWYDNAGNVYLAYTQRPVGKLFLSSR